MLCPMLLLLLVCFGSVAQEVNAYSISGHRYNGSMFCFLLKHSDSVIEWGEWEFWKFYLDPFWFQENMPNQWMNMALLGPSASPSFFFSSAVHSWMLSQWIMMECLPTCKWFMTLSSMVAAEKCKQSRLFRHAVFIYFWFQVFLALGSRMHLLSNCRWFGCLLRKFCER